MVVGGLSRQENDMHATEVADMSLTILSSLMKFRVRHRPEMSLRMRIGLHSGPCCAGTIYMHKRIASPRTFLSHLHIHVCLCTE